MQVISTQLCYILKALFRYTSLAYSFCTSGGRWPGGQVVRWPGGQVAGGTEKIGEWGIPEKSIQNVAELH